MARLGTADFTLGDGGTLQPGGPTGGGGYDGEALRALADAYLDGSIQMSPDNPYKQMVDARTPGHGWGTMGTGDLHDLVSFNKLAYGRALSTALRYEALRSQAEKAFGGPGQRLAEMRRPYIDRGATLHRGPVRAQAGA